MPKKISSPLTTIKRSRATTYHTDFDQLKAEVLGDTITQGDYHHIHSLPIDKLCRGRYQPRIFGDEDPDLKDLVDSIQSLGVIEPLAVRPVAAQPGSYEILAGDRRWRAAQQAGLSHVPVIVHAVDDRTAAAIALVENLQREDLNPIEEAMGLQRLMGDFGLSQNQVAELIGKSESTVSKCLGLLKLPALIRDMIQKRELEAGHGKVLLNMPLDDQMALASQAIQYGWSVRVLEKQKTNFVARKHQKRMLRSHRRDPNIKRLETKLSEWFSARVRVAPNHKGGGKIEITYSNPDECESILQRFGFTYE